MQFLREGRSGRDSKKGEETVDLVRRLDNELAIPLHDIGSLVQVPQHWACAHHLNRIRLEQERRYNAEVSSASADGPEQVGILVGVRDDKSSISQNNIGC